MPSGMFINQEDTLVAASYQYSRIHIYLNGSRDITNNITNNRLIPQSLFITDDNELLAAYASVPPFVDFWDLNNQTLLRSIAISGSCYSVFVDINAEFYCSQSDLHRVISQPKTNSSNSFTVVAGTGFPGGNSSTLNHPWGIFITATLDLYVADCSNNRIQLFQTGNRNATTVAGAGSNGTIALNNPRSIIVDVNGYLYIADYNLNRIIRSGSEGDRCVVGCTGSGGAAANQLLLPTTLSFDSHGNLFVMDGSNGRIQKFDLISSIQCSK